MPVSTSNADQAQPDGHRPSLAARHSALLSRHPWLTFLMPFVVYMVVGMLEPAPPKPPKHLTDGRTVQVASNNRFGLEYRHYPLVYTAKLALTLAAMLFVLPGYRQFPWRVSLLAVGIGVIGVVLWIALCHLGLERQLLGPIGLAEYLGLGGATAFDPLTMLADTPVWAYVFLAIRFVGLVLVVPVIEEFFLRGFLMRLVIREDWSTVPFGTLTPAAAVLGTVVPMMMHPAELLAALVWFSLVTWLMWRTKNIWDCVAAHAVTNLLLGIYVVTQHEWQPW